MRNHSTGKFRQKSLIGMSAGVFYGKFGRGNQRVINDDTEIEFFVQNSLIWLVTLETNLYMMLLTAMDKK